MIKYVSSICHPPADRLNVVLGIRPPRHVHEMPFGELNALYTHIFTSVEDWETVLLIIGFQLLPSFCNCRFYPSAEELEDFLLLNRGDIKTFALSGWIWNTIPNGTTQISQWELTRGVFMNTGTSGPAFPIRCDRARIYRARTSIIS